MEEASTEAPEEDAEEILKKITETPMPRPCKRRHIRGNPNSNYFKPAGMPMRELKEIVLDMSEFEALRLVDFQKISQEEAAEKMQVSQPTLSRMLSSGRSKIADSIVNGKAIKIQKSK